MDWSRIEQQVQYQTQSLGQQQPYRRAGGSSLLSSSVSGSRGNSTERGRFGDRERDRERDYAQVNNSRDFDIRDSRDFDREMRSSTNAFPAIADQAQTTSLDELLREFNQMKQTMNQQQSKIVSLEQRVASLSKNVEATHEANSDRFSSLEISFGTMNRQLNQNSRFENYFSDTANQMKAALVKVDTLDNSVSRLVEEQVPKELISQITKSVATSSKQLDQLVNEVRDISTRALRSTESIVSAILSQGEDKREYQSPRSGWALEDLSTSIPTAIRNIAHSAIVDGFSKGGAMPMMVPPPPSSSSSGREGSSFANLTSLATKQEVEDTKSELNHKVEYCLKTLAQLSQSIHDTAKASGSSSSELKELQTALASMDKNLKGLRDTQNATQEFVNSLQTMAQQGRQTSISEMQHLSEGVAALQNTVTALKNSTKKDYTEIKDSTNEFHQRERKRQMDKEVEDNEHRNDVNRKLQSLESKITDMDVSAVVSAVKETVSKLLMWQSDITCTIEQQQRTAAATFEAVRKESDDAMRVISDKHSAATKHLSSESSRLQDDIIALQKTISAHRTSSQSEIDKISTSLKEVISDKLRPLESYLQQTNDKLLSTGREVIVLNDQLSQLSNRLSSEIGKVSGDISKVSKEFDEKCAIIDDVAENNRTEMLHDVSALKDQLNVLQRTQESLRKDFASELDSNAQRIDNQFTVLTEKIYESLDYKVKDSETNLAEILEEALSTRITDETKKIKKKLAEKLKSQHEEFTKNIETGIATVSDTVAKQSMELTESSVKKIEENVQTVLNELIRQQETEVSSFIDIAKEELDKVILRTEMKLMEELKRKTEQEMNKINANCEQNRIEDQLIVKNTMSELEKEINVMIKTSTDHLKNMEKSFERKFTQFMEDETIQMQEKLLIKSKELQQEIQSFKQTQIDSQKVSMNKYQEQLDEKFGVQISKFREEIYVTLDSKAKAFETQTMATSDQMISKIQEKVNKHSQQVRDELHNSFEQITLQISTSQSQCQQLVTQQAVDCTVELKRNCITTMDQAIDNLNSTSKTVYQHLNEDAQRTIDDHFGKVMLQVKTGYQEVNNSLHKEIHHEMDKIRVFNSDRLLKIEETLSYLEEFAVKMERDFQSDSYLSRERFDSSSQLFLATSPAKSISVASPGFLSALPVQISSDVDDRGLQLSLTPEASPSIAPYRIKSANTNTNASASAIGSTATAAMDSSVTSTPGADVVAQHASLSLEHRLAELGNVVEAMKRKLSNLDANSNNIEKKLVEMEGENINSIVPQLKESDLKISYLKETVELLQQGYQIILEKIDADSSMSGTSTCGADGQQKLAQDEAVSGSLVLDSVTPIARSSSSDVGILSPSVDHFRMETLQEFVHGLQTEVIAMRTDFKLKFDSNEVALSSIAKKVEQSPDELSGKLLLVDSLQETVRSYESRIVAVSEDVQKVHEQVSATVTELASQYGELKECFSSASSSIKDITAAVALHEEKLAQSATESIVNSGKLSLMEEHVSSLTAAQARSEQVMEKKISGLIEQNELIKQTSESNCDSFNALLSDCTKKLDLLETTEQSSKKFLVVQMEESKSNLSKLENDLRECVGQIGNLDLVSREKFDSIRILSEEIKFVVDEVKTLKSQANQTAAADADSKCDEVSLRISQLDRLYNSRFEDHSKQISSLEEKHDKQLNQLSSDVGQQHANIHHKLANHESAIEGIRSLDLEKKFEHIERELTASVAAATDRSTIAVRTEQLQSLVDKLSKDINDVKQANADEVNSLRGDLSNHQRVVDANIQQVDMLVASTHSELEKLIRQIQNELMLSDSELAKKIGLCITKAEQFDQLSVELADISKTCASLSVSLDELADHKHDDVEHCISQLNHRIKELHLAVEDLKISSQSGTNSSPVRSIVNNAVVTPLASENIIDSCQSNQLNGNTFEDDNSVESTSDNEDDDTPDGADYSTEINFESKSPTVTKGIASAQSTPFNAIAMDSSLDLSFANNEQDSMLYDRIFSQSKSQSQPIPIGSIDTPIAAVGTSSSGEQFEFDKVYSAAPDVAGFNRLRRKYASKVEPKAKSPAKQLKSVSVVQEAITHDAPMKNFQFAHQSVSEPSLPLCFSQYCVVEEFLVADTVPLSSPIRAERVIQDPASLANADVEVGDEEEDAQVTVPVRMSPNKYAAYDVGMDDDSFVSSDSDEDEQEQSPTKNTADTTQIEPVINASVGTEADSEEEVTVPVHMSPNKYAQYDMGMEDDSFSSSEASDTPEGIEQQEAEATGPLASDNDGLVNGADSESTVVLNAVADVEVANPVNVSSNKNAVADAVLDNHSNSSSEESEPVESNALAQTIVDSQEPLVAKDSYRGSEHSTPSKLKSAILSSTSRVIIAEAEAQAEETVPCGPSPNKYAAFDAGMDEDSFSSSDESRNSNQVEDDEQAVGSSLPNAEIIANAHLNGGASQADIQIEPEVTVSVPASPNKYAGFDLGMDDASFASSEESETLDDGNKLIDNAVETFHVPLVEISIDSAVEAAVNESPSCPSPNKNISLGEGNNSVDALNKKEVEQEEVDVEPEVTVPVRMYPNKYAGYDVGMDDSSFSSSETTEGPAEARNNNEDLNETGSEIVVSENPSSLPSELQNLSDIEMSHEAEITVPVRMSANKYAAYDVGMDDDSFSGSEIEEQEQSQTDEAKSGSNPDATQVDAELGAEVDATVACKASPNKYASYDAGMDDESFSSSESDGMDTEASPEYAVQHVQVLVSEDSSAIDGLTNANIDLHVNSTAESAVELDESNAIMTEPIVSILKSEDIVEHVAAPTADAAHQTPKKSASAETAEPTEMTFPVQKSPNKYAAYDVGMEDSSFSSSEASEDSEDEQATGDSLVNAPHAVDAEVSNPNRPSHSAISASSAMADDNLDFDSSPEATVPVRKSPNKYAGYGVGMDDDSFSSSEPDAAKGSDDGEMQEEVTNDQARIANQQDDLVEEFVSFEDEDGEHPETD